MSCHLQQRLWPNRIKQCHQHFGSSPHSCVRQHRFHQHLCRRRSHLRRNCSRRQVLGWQCQWAARHREYNTVRRSPARALSMSFDVRWRRSSAPVQALAAAATSVSAGAYFSCATTSSGVSCWGQNNFGQVGRSTSSCVHVFATCCNSPTHVCSSASVSTMSAGEFFPRDPSCRQ
jgi:hypothetical protein